MALVTIADFELLELIAESSRAKLHRARHRGSGEIVALKQVADATAACREIRALNQLKHPQVVQIIDSGNEHGFAALALEWLDGLTLDQAAPLLYESWIVLAQQIHAALTAVHRQDLLHLDVKPGNVMHDSKAGWKLIDFGECHPAFEARLHAMTGSIHTMAPELFSGGEVDARTDFYALGCTLFFAWTGRMAHDGELTPQVMTRHLHPPDLAADSDLARLPEPWRLWLIALMKRDPGQRPLSLPCVPVG
jgi:serine/threonine protein kinase